MCLVFFFFKQKTAYEMRISDWSSDVCSSDLGDVAVGTDEWKGRVRRPAVQEHRHDRQRLAGAPEHDACVNIGDDEARRDGHHPEANGSEEKVDRGRKQPVHQETGRAKCRDNGVSKCSTRW